MEHDNTVADQILDYLGVVGTASRADILKTIRRNDGQPSVIAIDKALARLEKAQQVMRPYQGTYVITPEVADEDALLPHAIRFAFDELVPRRVQLWSSVHLEWRIFSAYELVHRHVLKKRSYVPLAVFEKALAKLQEDGVARTIDHVTEDTIVGRAYFICTNRGLQLHDVLA